MPTAVAVRHVAFEDLGLIAPVLAERGYDIRYVEAPTEPMPAEDADLVVVLGGPIGAYEDDAYPFLRAEMAFLERRLAAGRPTLGICLGAQLMARALGARVYPGPAKEIGWAPLTLSAAGRASCLAELGPEPTVLHWHGDTFDLPEGAVHLASTDLCANQAFSWGAAALALQFHAEAMGAALEPWFVGHTVEIGATPGVDVPQLRADTARWTPVMADRGRRLFNRWLDGLAAAAKA